MARITSAASYFAVSSNAVLDGVALAGSLVHLTLNLSVRFIGMPTAQWEARKPNIPLFAVEQ